MALNKDVLGLALANKAATYNDVDVDVNDPAAMNAYRLNFWKGIAEEVIEHFKANIQLSIPGTGLTSPSGAVTGTALTGTIL